LGLSVKYTRASSCAHPNVEIQNRRRNKFRIAIRLWNQKYK
jgi:hypothetical protein